MRGGGLGGAVSTRTGPNDATRAPTTPTSHYDSLEPLRLRRQPKRPPTSHYDSVEPLRLRHQPKRPPTSLPTRCWLVPARRVSMDHASESLRLRYGPYWWCM